MSIKSIAATMAIAAMLTPTAVMASNRDNNETRFANVVNPTLPHSITFAGQKFDLDNSDYYERLDRELTAMAFTHGSTLLTLKRANRYMPIIVPILKANGVPEDLVYLSAIESNFDPLALSGAKAAGLWQFMPSTGREYGLQNILKTPTPSMAAGNRWQQAITPAWGAYRENSAHRAPTRHLTCRSPRRP